MAFSEPQKLRIRRQAHFRCCLCQNLGVEIHHIIPQSEGGPDDDDNAAPLCPTCHEVHGGNPVRRKFIREARDHWYEICVTRFVNDPDRIDRMTELLENTASRADLHDAIRKLEGIISKELHRPNAKAAAAVELVELSSVLQDLYIAGKLASVLLTRRKWQVIMAVSHLPRETEKKWFALAKRALKSEMATFWLEELAGYAIDGRLAQRIDEESVMSEEVFTQYLEGVVARDIQAVADQPDITLGELSTADAEWIQAAQAPAELYDEWSAASDDERPLLMARWVSEGRVRRINFAPGNQPRSETPGFFYMRRGRDLLVSGKKKEGFALIRAGLQLDPVVASEAFALWLSNPLIEESENLLSDDEIAAFVAGLYGPEMPDSVRAMRRDKPDA